MPEQNTKLSASQIFSVSTVTILKIVGVLLGLYFLYVIRDILMILVISALLASAMNPLVEWFYRRLRFPRGLTVVLVYFLFIGLLVLALSLIIPAMVSEFKDLSVNFSGYRYQFDVQGSFLDNLFQRFGITDFFQSLGSMLSDLAGSVLKKTLGVFSGIFQLITIFVISFYLVSQQDALKDFLKSLAPSNYHAAISNAASRVQGKLGSWLLGQIALMASIFAMMYLVLSLLGVKYALTLALLSGLLEIVPYIGPITSAVPGVFIAALQSPTLALLVLFVYWAVQQIENYFLVPRIIGKSIGANPLVVLIAVMIGFNLAGFVGILISAPIVAVGSVAVSEYRAFRSSQPQRDK